MNKDDVELIEAINKADPLLSKGCMSCSLENRRKDRSSGYFLSFETKVLYRLT
ncbi:hypothetical protein [Sphingobacterium sp. HMA12]|uniref:hypothetical protein n=1 Tax=Sphingobacterium sp. HMA12 TaxID=2050894 RepID=UPI0013159C45|nr:hypothetical protein [Sphingobacterium sp. HMA12]